VQSGRAREAQTLLQDGIRLAPQHVPFVTLLARLQVEQGNDAQAITTLESARASAANDAGFLSFLATLYQRGGRHVDAIKNYRDALALNAQDARAWLGLAISLDASADAAGATDAYNRALQIGLDPQLVRYAQQRLAALKK
jgi:MSHA biogenesis protein MshN